MMYSSNGGFNWTDLYHMPTHLREFYWKELIAAKDAEKEMYNKASKKGSSASSIARRR
jgi:hypothetical protein